MQNCLIKQTNSGQLNYLQHPLLNSVGADLLRRAIPSGDPVQFLKANSSSRSPCIAQSDTSFTAGAVISLLVYSLLKFSPL